MSNERRRENSTKETPTRRVKGSNRRSFLGTVGTVMAGAGVANATSGRHTKRQDDQADETTYEASVRRALLSQRLLSSDGRYSSADEQGLASIDRGVGDQVRIRRSDDEVALFTVSETRDEQRPSVVRMGLAGRQRLGTDLPFEGTVDATVPNSELSEEDARERDEYIEHLQDADADLAVLSPNGGNIGPYTSAQADTAAGMVSSGAVRWGCKGWYESGDAAERWYVPPYEMSPASYPELAGIVGRNFRYVVSFQSFGGDGIRVSGPANGSFMSDLIKRIESAVGDDHEVIRRTLSEGGADQEATRLVERLAADDGTGVWIGQSLAARADSADAIAEAVGDTLTEHL